MTSATMRATGLIVLAADGLRALAAASTVAAREYAETT